MRAGVLVQRGSLRPCVPPGCERPKGQEPVWRLEDKC